MDAQTHKRTRAHTHDVTMHYFLVRLGVKPWSLARSLIFPLASGCPILSAAQRSGPIHIVTLDSPFSESWVHSLKTHPFVQNSPFFASRYSKKFRKRPQTRPTNHKPTTDPPLPHSDTGAVWPELCSRSKYAACSSTGSTPGGLCFSSWPRSSRQGPA